MGKSTALTALLAKVDGPEPTSALRGEAVAAIELAEGITIKTREQKVVLDNAMFNLGEADKPGTSERQKRIRYSSISLTLKSVDPSIITRIGDAVQQQIAKDVQTRLDIAGDIKEGAAKIADKAASGLENIFIAAVIAFFVSQAIQGVARGR